MFLITLFNLYLFCFQPGVSFHSNKYSSAKQQQINYQRNVLLTELAIYLRGCEIMQKAAFLYIFRDLGGGDVNCNTDI